MKCPICPDIALVMSERQNVEIDYCPQCRGVWLDRGELDKIIERSQAPDLPANSGSHLPRTTQPDHSFELVSHSDPSPGHKGGWREPHNSDRHGSGQHQNQSGYQAANGTRKKSFLSELFD
ncbi:zf-TFIIB domain-containing protein [Pseudomonas syringae]|uniref:TFIIB-type zinc ribbon-containing protein n=1 Tax=Pseudomonas syringae TaxID=317 RepID=UPI001F989ACD|nr:zf-TFIIB domain-containing protein [Pseudomonas syringae]MCF5227934.1 hypothetical protein [Pseudomonas syringae]MCF5244232.1 hypothetical protein [Pseudomonas syringae]